MTRLEQDYDVGYTKSFFDTETVYGIGQHDSSGCIVEGRVDIFSNTSFLSGTSKKC